MYPVTLLPTTDAPSAAKFPPLMFDDADLNLSLTNAVRFHDFPAEKSHRDSVKLRASVADPDGSLAGACRGGGLPKHHMGECL